MSNSRAAFRAFMNAEQKPLDANDIVIPDLDNMTRSQLRAYAAKTTEAMRVCPNPKKQNWLNLAARYAESKADAMSQRIEGDHRSAVALEERCGNIYREIPKRMRWR